MRPEQRMRIRPSMSGSVQAPGAAARASCSSRAKAASGDRSSAACKGNAASRPTTTARTQTQEWVNLRTARGEAGDSTESRGGTDFDDVHLGEGIRPIAIYRPAVLGAKNTLRHQVELLAGQM